MVALTLDQLQSKKNTVAIVDLLDNGGPRPNGSRLGEKRSRRLAWCRRSTEKVVWHTVRERHAALSRQISTSRPPLSLCSALPPCGGKLEQV